MTEEEARKRVRKLRGFYSHLSSYAIINTFLFGLNMMTAPDRIWFVFPAMGWGIGLAFHALGTFNLFGNSREWEDRKVKELMRQDEEPISAGRLYNMLDERIANLNAPPSGEAGTARLQARIEALEKELSEQKKRQKADGLSDLIQPFEPGEPDGESSTARKKTRS